MMAHKQLVDNGLRMLVMFLNTWRNAIGSNPLGGNPSNALNSKMSSSHSTNTVKEAPGFVQQQQQNIVASTTTSNSSGNSSVNSSGVSSITQTTATVVDVVRKSNSIEQPLGTTFHLVEGLALVVLCNSRPQPRKLAVHIMKEVKNLKKALGIPENEPPLIDVIDKCCPSVSYLFLFSKAHYSRSRGKLFSRGNEIFLGEFYTGIPECEVK